MGRRSCATLRPNFYGYGLGFGVRDYRGHKLVTHTGGLPGYVSKVAMIPDAQLGIAILTNQESGAAFDAIVDHIIDAYLGAQPTDWIAAYQAIEQRAARRGGASTRQSTAARDAASKPSLPLDQYAGTYRDAWYGDMTISAAGGGADDPVREHAVARRHARALAARHVRGELDGSRAARRRVRHLRAEPGRRRSTRVKMRAVSPDTDFSFDFQDLLFRPMA